MTALRRQETQPGGPPIGGGSVPSSPDARRVTRPTWRDPRLLVGVVIVAVCVLLGAQLLARADDTVAVWAAGADLPAGAVVGADDVEPARLRFASSTSAERYLSADEPLPEGMVATRDVGAGELVPRAAVGTETTEDVAELPIAVAAEAVPTGLAPGEVVDVWVAPPSGTGRSEPAVRVLEGVTVVAAAEEATALGPSATRQVVVGVPAEDESLLAHAIADLAAGTVVLVRKG